MVQTIPGKCSLLLFLQESSLAKQVLDFYFAIGTFVRWKII